MNRLAFFLSAAALALLAGCSTSAWYDTVQSASRVDCGRYGTADERERCYKEQNRSYDQYRREREAAQGKPAS